ncbi:MAG: hypothetical protein HND47_04895 [Chloroflexi bacterium]|nr:hypothetical protein [Chloroflexota bacterium]
MDSKTLNVLEYPKILERLAGYCDFSASMELARSLEPSDSYDLAVSPPCRNDRGAQTALDPGREHRRGARHPPGGGPSPPEAACSTRKRCWTSNPRSFRAAS